MITSLLYQDYDDFDVANEDDELEEFLGIPRKTPKVIVLLTADSCHKGASNE